jgi:glycosyltransferase involved in cell wall biosynthesis
MKILIGADLHWPTINGVATFTRNLAKGLADRGHEVVVIAPSQTGKAYKEIDGNHVVYRTASVPFAFYQNFRISPTPGAEVRKIIKEFDPDVIHVMMMMWLGQAAMKYGNKFGIPIVTTNHAVPENLMDNIKLLAPVARPINYMLNGYGARFHSKADYMTLPTQAAIEMLNASDKIDIPMEAVSNGIDLSRFKSGTAPKSIYKKFKLPENKPIISYIGRIDAEKHLQTLVKAFGRIAPIYDADLMIVGFGTDTENLKDLIAKLKITNRVHFTGKVSDEDLPLLHQVGTVYAMPSPVELQSIATLEAMASGQPVVAVDAGALKELCQNDRNGFLCELDNDEQMAIALLAIVADKDLRVQFSKQSLEIAKTHNMNYTLDRFIAIYEELIATK